MELASYARGSISGFKRVVKSPVGCNIIDTLNMAWGANTDGEPVDGVFNEELHWSCEYGWHKSAPHANGVLFLGYPGTTASQPPVLSYNWWTGFFVNPAYDFGPRRKENYRDFQTGGTGWPLGDANRYHVMSNGEIDYDMLYSASIGLNDPVWLSPPYEVAYLTSTQGLSTGIPNLLSIGPYDIPPGFTVTFPLAFVCGKNFHTDPNNKANLPHQLDRFYDNLDFSDLIQNATWAKWVYDNPGVDTDGDDYAGKYAMCGDDTVYLSGDGIPDWRAAIPPPAPVFRLEPLVNGIRILFNGQKSETQTDGFTGLVDFEGYRIYSGLDRRASSMALIASYDRKNFDKYIWNGATDSTIAYNIFDPPFTLDSLRCLYGTGENPCRDTTFDPLSFTITSQYFHPEFEDSIFYFLPHDHNAFEFGITTPISKVYPDLPDPATYHPDSIPGDAYTEEGYLKFYEYEFTLENLMPTIPYWINVTALDHGNIDLGIKGLESPVGSGAQAAYPLAVSDAAAGGNTKVYVYPNPYRGDAGYRDLGFEGRTQDDRPDHRVRAVNFANLPPKCTIYIYSLDGDLVRKLDHDMDPSDPNSSHDSWNMITRNTQMVVSGLYYWVVEFEDGSTQMGKLVVIM
ncbi:MAG: hypothetical protein JSU74_04065 [Candidatus Zixiibacteriota bacterium]|nr:MAG: hypothetical protein JSU74_04065 [candidate division Zixibacteria bacterium]